MTEAVVTGVDVCFDAFLSFFETLPVGALVEGDGSETGQNIAT